MDVKEQLAEANKILDSAKQLAESLQTIKDKGGLLASQWMAMAATWNFESKDRAFDGLRGIK
jgi:uncharacterized protein YukE